MTDRQWTELLALTRRRSFPPDRSPGALFPNGMGVPVIVDEDLDPADSPQLRDDDRAEIRVTHDDLDDLYRRLDAIATARTLPID